ncbi:phage portal protein [Clostridia bacterium]|nr:phage portal protein [Clostridia bacterium]
MSFLDTLINAVSPKRAYERALWRQELTNLRSYDAGSFDRLNAAWRVINESAEMGDRSSRDVIRARSRDLEQNSDIANAILAAHKRNVIGSGFTLQAKTGDEVLDELIEDYWKAWCRKENCDVTGVQSFNQILRMAVIRKKVDGGILILKRYTKGGVVPFKLQTIEVDELDSGVFAPRNKENKIAGGIEYNSFNKAVGYYIRQYQLDGMISEPVYIPAKDVIFYFTKRRPSQVREMSDMVTSITRIRDINEFMTAVAVKERIAACLAVFIKKVLPQGITGRNVSKPMAGSGGYGSKNLTPGMITELNPGDDIGVVDPKSQSIDATNFLKLQQRLIGSGQGLSYEAVSRDMSETNYSSARQGAIEDELTYAEEVEALRETVMDEIYETFVISLYLCGKLELADFWDNPRKYLKHNWVSPAKKWIDPQKESNANKIALLTGQKSYQQIAAESGKDWKEIIDENAEAMEYAKSKGITIMGGGDAVGEK